MDDTEEEIAPEDHLFEDELEIAQEVELKSQNSPKKLPPLLAGLLDASSAPSPKCVPINTAVQNFTNYFTPITQLLDPTIPIFPPPNRLRTYSAGVVNALENLYNTADAAKLAEELTQHYPEPRGLQFLKPEPLGDAEAHLKTSKLFFALKADTCLVRLADTQALLARPLADLLSYLAETADGPLDSAFVAERLTDMAKTLVVSAKINETSRVNLACAAFEVPTSAAKTERGSS